MCQQLLTMPRRNLSLFLTFYTLTRLANAFTASPAIPLGFKSLKSSFSTQASFKRADRLYAHKKGELCSTSRRSYFYDCAQAAALSSFSLAFFPEKAMAEENDLTSQLFNSDGSLKEGSSLSTEASFRTVSVSFPDSTDIIFDSPVTFINGQSKSKLVDTSGTREVSYQTPSKWTPDSTYSDTTAGVNLPSCNRILVYQSVSKTSSPVLEKAAMTGVAKALQAQSSGNLNLGKADLVAGKKEEKNGVLYWNFDLAVAPLTCAGERKKEDLGLGFCPYDYIVLLSAAIVNDRMYVFQLECDRDQWRRSNADLKRVRQSFVVEV